jgi:hypothetical protein
LGLGVSEQKVELGGDFKNGNYAILVRVGNVVTITAEGSGSSGEWEQASAGASAQSDAVIPSSFQYSQTSGESVRQVVSINQLQQTLMIVRNARIIIAHYAHNGATTSASSTVEAVSMTYVIKGSVS